MVLETTIKVSIDTRNKLIKLGKKNQTYDSIIQELIHTKIYYTEKESDFEGLE